MAKKIDGVVEAVRYKNGQIIQVRAYERRGATYSDRIILDRKTLSERLQKGGNFVTGSRQAFMASSFSVGKTIQLVKDNDHTFIATHGAAKSDELENVPVF